MNCIQSMQRTMGSKTSQYNKVVVYSPCHNNRNSTVSVSDYKTVTVDRSVCGMCQEVAPLKGALVRQDCSERDFSTTYDYNSSCTEIHTG